MKFFAGALVLSLAALAGAQDVSSSSGTSSTSGTSSSVSSSTSSSSSAPASTTPAPSSSSGSSAGGAGGACSILVGDPKAPQPKCTFSSTFTPPYDASSIQSYLIGGYEPNQAAEIEDVAGELAGSVVRYYPSLIASSTELREEFASAISASITAARNSDGAYVNHVPGAIGQFAMAAVAVVAAGAFML